MTMLPCRLGRDGRHLRPPADHSNIKKISRADGRSRTAYIQSIARRGTPHTDHHYLTLYKVGTSRPPRHSHGPKAHTREHPPIGADGRTYTNTYQLRAGNSAEMTLAAPTEPINERGKIAGPPTRRRGQAGSSYACAGTRRGRGPTPWSACPQGSHSCEPSPP